MQGLEDVLEGLVVLIDSVVRQVLAENLGKLNTEGGG